MNRRQLGLGAATAAFASAVGLSAQAQTRDPAAIAFYDSFNDRLARLPSTLQPDVRAFYEMNGWRPVWNEPRRRALMAAAARAERHGLSRDDFFGSLDRNGDDRLTPDELPGGRGREVSLAEHRQRLAEAFHRQDANRDGVLQVQASFRNDAQWPQPWPRLLLRLNDRHGRTVGARLFAPGEYLGRRTSTPELLAPGQSASVDFAVREPAAEIVAFDFDFR